MLLCSAPHSTLYSGLLCLTARAEVFAKAKTEHKKTRQTYGLLPQSADWAVLPQIMAECQVIPQHAGQPQRQLGKMTPRYDAAKADTAILLHLPLRVCKLKSCTAAAPWPTRATRAKHHGVNARFCRAH